MKIFLRNIILLYILISPFYLFPSGLPQISDILIAFGGIVFILGGGASVVTDLPVVKKMLYFVALVTIINLIAWFHYEVLNGLDNMMFFTPLFYIFNALFFIMFITVMKKENHLNVRNISLFSWAILLTVSIQFFLAVSGVASGGGRGTLFFNNPNQLGYFTLLMLSIYTVLPSRIRSNMFLSLWIIFASSYLVLYSGSRAALAGILLLAIIIFYKEGFKLELKSVLFMLILIASIPPLLQTSFVNEKVESLVARNENTMNANVTEAQIRGYDRFALYPEYVFYGAGEGYNLRFKSFHQLEMHSGPGTILFSYGILGFILFFSFLFEAIKRQFWYYSLVLIPAFIYNLTHQGFRETLFWVLLASIYLVSSASKQIKFRRTFQRQDIVKHTNVNTSISRP